MTEQERKTILMQECIYDISLELPRLMQEDWWDKYTDSRDIFHEVRAAAAFYEENYDDRCEYIEDIGLLAEAWFARYFGVPSTFAMRLALCDNQHIAEIIRDTNRRNFLYYSSIDFLRWYNIEKVLGMEITPKEYEKLCEACDNINDLMHEDKINRKWLSEELAVLRGHKRFRVKYTVTETRTVYDTIVDSSEDAARQWARARVEGGHYAKELQEQNPDVDDEITVEVDDDARGC